MEYKLKYCYLYLMGNQNKKNKKIIKMKNKIKNLNLRKIL